MLDITMEALTILIIEDEPEIRLILSLCLEHSGKFHTLLASDGIDGIEKARESRPDVILLDAIMPRMDGYATCRQLKEDPELAKIPVIFLTAKTDQREVDRALRAGACCCLAKPFDPLTLADHIEAACPEVSKLHVL
jgi:CheY-like chemotaxis protein